MSNILIYKDRYNEEFADLMYQRYKLDRFGLTIPACAVNPMLTDIRQSLLQWQRNEDAGALTEVSVNFMAWLPVTYKGVTTAGIGGLSTNAYMTEEETVSMGFPYGNNQTQNIIDVSVGGCITRINVNPTININPTIYNGNAQVAKEFVQTTPSALWTIVHGLSFTPNAYVLDTNGYEIDGVVSVVSSTTIEIAFSNPVAGTAYLS